MYRNCHRPWFSVLPSITSPSSIWITDIVPHNVSSCQILSSLAAFDVNYVLSLILFPYTYSDVLKTSERSYGKAGARKVTRWRKGCNLVVWQLWHFCFQKPPWRMRTALGHPGEVPNSKPTILPDTQPLFPLFPFTPITGFVEFMS